MTRSHRSVTLTRRRMALLAAVAVVPLAACEDDDPVVPNRAPVAAITATPTSVPANDGNQTVVRLDGSGSTDPDGDDLTFSWTVANGTFVNGTSASSEIAEVTFPGNAPYAVTLTVSDGRGGTDDATTTIQLGPPANAAPTASFTVDPTEVREGDANRTSVTLDASASSDPDGDDLTFTWDAPNATFVNGTDESSMVAEVTFPGAAPYDVTLTVDDSNGGIDEAQATVGIIPNTVPEPSIVANPTFVPVGDNNQTVVTLDASGSTDADGDALTFSWDVPTGTFVNGTDATSEVAQVTLPGDADVVVTLTVDDGFGGTNDAQVTITSGQANQAPTAVVTANPTSVPAGDNNNTVVTIDASTSSDPDGDALTYSWVVPSGTFVNGTTNTDPTIQVTFPGAAPYTVTVTVDDGNGGQDEASVTITIS